MNAKRQTVTGVVLGDDLRLRFAEFCRLANAAHDQVVEMVMEGVIEAQGASPREWRFTARDLRRAQRALRLARDLELNTAALALVLDLLEEVEELRRWQRLSGG